MASQINQAFGANVATVQGNQMVLSGGASIAKTKPAPGPTAGKVTVKNLNAISLPGRMGLLINPQLERLTMS